ncbi:hypothetical protein C8A00DRAFT_46657 [Chaetomidium leptoderma]|uniref:Tat pathway signal sequence n=1 Tax=Chaetomidium leptoderma TaxID=669021 RepID=A0AAN6ZTS1_9PEZI|nr:hypothetical protein C8A00DRAFT_46657 [Chaetomidium leptoderma]
MGLGQLQELISDTSLPVAKLEGGVEAGLQTLSDVKAAFAKAKSVSEIAEWIKASDKLRSRSATQRTVVGVVGSTGAGKSSVINAVLDEECLVPTNCMRACTAVITEIAYNQSDREDERYRAEIHFVTRDDWVKELRVMLADMTTGQDSLGGDNTTSESEASIAYHKIRAVYPFLRSDEIKKGKFDVNELTEHPSVKGLLANVVKVFVRSPILESGLVLVDLPSVHDSNAARSAVASKYIEQCSGLWVVAPITRAVDDKVAQNLLGDSFKRQLQLDGTYSSITVICSKADDLSVTEKLKGLPEEAHANQLQSSIGLRETERDKLQELIDTMKARAAELNGDIDQRLTEIVSLKAAIDGSLSDDEEDILLFSPSRKRPARAAAIETRKRMRRRQSSDSEGTDSTYEEELSASEAEPEVENISKEVAKQRLQDAEARLSDLRAESKDLKQRGPARQKELREMKAEIKLLKSETKQACIKYRNDYSRPVIQSQFAEGIREIDQENASQDEENFDPNQSHRDYRKVAEQLPVFCVSSKAYQKLSGRLENDERIAGFTRLEETEIPALQRQALGIVQETRAENCRRFLRDLSGFLTSLHLQVVQSDQPLKLADDLREKELQSLTKAMDELKQELMLTIRAAFIQCREAVDLNVFRKFESAARIASYAAIPTIRSWICHKDDGGLAYQTFRATCVRDGIYKGKNGLLDFNKALAKPMTQHLARSWEYTFSTCLPERLDILAEALGRVLRSFRLRMARSPQLKKASSFPLATRQVKILERRLKDTAKFKATITKGQKGANRLFVPIIGEAMAEAYTYCAEESGIGCFKRIKAHLIEHVEGVRGTMFKAATRKTESALNSTLDEVESDVKHKVDNILVLINRDYSALLTSQNIFKALSTSRDDVRNLLGQVDGRFERVLRPLPEPEEMAAMDVDHVASAESASPVAARTTYQAPTAMAIDDEEFIKREPNLEAAPGGGDVSMRDAV